MPLHLSYLMHGQQNIKMPLHVSSTMCSSSGGQNYTIQHLVSSHSVGGRPAYRLREYWDVRSAKHQ